MQRVLLVSVPSDAEPHACGVAARVLRDAGHEVVHGGSIAAAGAISAVASQEDVGLVLLIGDAEADVLAEELRGDGDPEIRVVRPDRVPGDILASVDS